MYQSILNRTPARLAALAVGLFAPFAAWAADLASVVPAASNAVATVDVRALLASPLGQKEAWQGKLMGNVADRPLAVPATANTLGLASFLQLPELSPMWQLAVIDAGAPIDLGKVASAQRGVLDQVAGKRAVTTRFDVMHVELAPNRIGTLWPAQRQLAARLLDAGGASRGASEFLTAALRADPENQITMALDLTEAFTGPAIRKAMAMGGLASLDKLENIDQLSNGLAAVRGVSVKVRVDSAVNLRLVADFAGPVPIPADTVKPFCLDVLAAAGVPADQFGSLQYQVQGNQIVASGPSSLATVSMLLGLLVPDSTHSVAEPGVASASVSSAGSAAPTAGANVATSSNPAAAASQRYYQSVCAILDRLSAGGSMSANATTLRGSSRQIQQLPVLNVDPELTAWGADVVDKMSQCTMILAAGQTSAQIAAQGIDSPASEATYSETGYSGSDSAASRAAFRNAQQQRRQAAQAERLRANEEAFKVINQASKDRAAIRATMTQRYGVEF